MKGFDDKGEEWCNHICDNCFNESILNNNLD